MQHMTVLGYEESYTQPTYSSILAVLRHYNQINQSDRYSILD